MRVTSAISVLALATTAFSKEKPKDLRLGVELYDSGIMMDSIMQEKLSYWQSQLESGAMRAAQWPKLGYAECVDGFAIPIAGDPAHKFRCKNTDLYSFINHADLGAASGRGSSSWGWTDPLSGREFIASGAYEGTALLEITNVGQLVKLGFLPSFSPIGPNSVWHEIRSYKNFMLIGSELAGHGIQIFDMSKLLIIDPAEPVMFDNIVGSGLHGHVDFLPEGSTHNVVVNEEKSYAVAVGTRPRAATSRCRGGLYFIDLTDPSKPTDLGCDPQDGYVHDAQCLVYHGPDTKYEGIDICYGYNEDTLTIYNVTDKNASKIISRTSYTGVAFTHQGWVLDTKNQSFIVLDDELDESRGIGEAAAGYPITYIWDISSLESPKQTGTYKGTQKAVDHNQYVIDGLSYQSNYGAGLREEPVLHSSGR